MITILVSCAIGAVVGAAIGLIAAHIMRPHWRKEIENEWAQRDDNIQKR